MQPIRDWLQQPVMLSEVLPYGVLALLLAAALAGLARTTRRAARTRPSSGATRPEGFLARWFRTMRLGPGEDLLIRATFAAFAVLFVMALGAVFVLVGGVLRQVISAPEGASPTASLGLGALLVALLGAPFLIWRTLVAQRTLEATHRQTDLQDEALFNDKINAAATDLAARRQVTRVVEQEGKETVLTQWQDDLVTRAAAIDRLEGLALEAMARGDFAPAQRIARMLSIYVQELSREYPAKAAPDYESREQIRNWTATLRPIPRPDMERAAQSLGRINPPDEAARVAFAPKNIDLRRCNLQGFDLRRLNYRGAQFGEAQIQGANLVGVKMQEADLGGAQMQGANLRWAQMQGVELGGAQMQGANLGRARMRRADLGWAQMQGADLREAQMHWADLGWAQMQGADLREAQMQGADLSGAQMSEDTVLDAATLRGASVRFLDDTTVAQLRPHWNDIILFAETLPDGAPAHWVQVADDALNYNTFHTRWHVWAAEHHPDVTIAFD